MTKLVLFCHSLRSDWNHGNAHFLRGVLSECRRRGIAVRAYEPADSWSAHNLAAEQGEAALDAWRAAYPDLPVTVYDPARLDLDRALDGADLVLVHEWNEPALVARIAAHRRRGGRYLLLFHDTHHRMVTDPDAIAAFDLDGFDGVLAFGEVLRERIPATRLGHARPSPGTRRPISTLFRPRPEIAAAARSRVDRQLGRRRAHRRTRRIPDRAGRIARRLRRACTACATRRRHAPRWPPPASNSPAICRTSACRRRSRRPRMTVHIPRRPYAEALPGIPTIRVFEALACGIPLVSAPWDDSEDLFRRARITSSPATAPRCARHLAALRADPDFAAALARAGPRDSRGAPQLRSPRRRAARDLPRLGRESRQLRRWRRRNEP